MQYYGGMSQKHGEIDLLVHQWRVRRVQRDVESVVLPELDADWPEESRLSWHAAVCMMDSGINISVHMLSGTFKRYCVSTSQGSSPALNCREAFDYCDALKYGALAYRHDIEQAANWEGIEAVEGV